MTIMHATRVQRYQPIERMPYRINMRSFLSLRLVVVGMGLKPTRNS